VNGWAIEARRQHDSQDAQDEADADALYHLLEREVVPAFCQRDADGLPRRWIEIALASAATVPPVFSTHRMVAQYARQMYVPAYRDRGT
jgi:starch phosphorylase